MDAWVNLAAAGLAVLTGLLGLTQYLNFKSKRQRQAEVGEAFARVVSGLAAGAEVERLSSAALLRRFFDAKSEFGQAGLPYAGDATKVIAAAMTIVVSSESMDYFAKCSKPTHLSAPLQYADFADWSARLNAFYSDRPLPPFARLALNREIAKQGYFPSEIQRKTHSRGKESVATSKMLTNWALSSDDLTSIAKVGAMLVEFQLVDAKTFFQKPAATTAQSPTAPKR